ncbi:MAG: ABC transporter permease [bacterium]
MSMPAPELPGGNVVVASAALASERGRVWRSLCRGWRTRISMLVLALFAAAALWGEMAYRWAQACDRTPSYAQVDLGARYLPPSIFRHPFTAAENTTGIDVSAASKLRAGLRALARHPLGTDNLGRDVGRRLIQGARIAFQVGVVTALIAIPLGLLLGLLAGYFGGWVDDVVVWLYSTVAAIPGLLFILAIALVVGKGLTGVYLGIGLTTWVGLCRLIRGETLKQREQTYVQAARAMGLGHVRILFRQILPNVFHLVIITVSLRFPAAVSTEVFLSFLGIGVQGEPSWGVMLGNARLRLWQGMWWEMTFVTIAIFAVVLAFNLLGDALRDALDPRASAKGEL